MNPAPQQRPGTRLSATVLGARDPRALGAFYARLLGWRVIEDQPGWVMVRPEGGGAGLSFQHEPELVPPTWPAQPGQQQVHAHLDIAVADLDHGVAWAVAVGAREADYQPQQNVRVMVDPEGHLFDVFVGPV